MHSLGGFTGSTKHATGNSYHHSLISSCINRVY